MFRKKQSRKSIEIYFVNHNVQSLAVESEMSSSTRINIIVMPRTEAAKGKGTLVVPSGEIRILKVD